LEYEELRSQMVERQIAARGVKDARVLVAMRRVPRHLFVEFSQRYKAYDDMALSIEAGQTISQPFIVAKMTEILGLSGNERVLEIGTGSGYQTAVLAELSHEVFTVERHKTLSERAMKLLLSLGYENVRFRVGDGTLGWHEEAPFDRILVTAATPDIPEPLPAQLSEGGIIVAPVGDRFSQLLLSGIKTDRRLKLERHMPCVFVPLVGRHGWSE